jgi:hypothetical protein
MRSALCGIGLLLIAAATAEAQGAKGKCPVNVFCGGWYSVCLRVSTQFPDYKEVCAPRMQQGVSTRCFPFRSPGPRCCDNPRDMALTTAARDIREVDCRTLMVTTIDLCRSEVGPKRRQTMSATISAIGGLPDVLCSL